MDRDNIVRLDHAYCRQRRSGSGRPSSPQGRAAQVHDLFPAELTPAPPVKPQALGPGNPPHHFRNGRIESVHLLPWGGDYFGLTYRGDKVRHVQMGYSGHVMDMAPDIHGTLWLEVLVNGRRRRGCAAMFQHIGPRHDPVA